jgi:hypothetical protein
LDPNIFGVQIEEKFPHQTKNWVYFCQGDLKWEDETIRQMLMTGLFGGVLFGMIEHEGGVILILCFWSFASIRWSLLQLECTW